jgi:surface protein
MAYVNNIRKVVGGSTDEWVRPADWLPIPAIATGEEVIYMLMAVYDVVGNFAALLVQGSYTVDWGDGSAVENINTNVKAEHSYNWADVGNVTTEGFRQALIKVTPQSGQHITLVNFQQFHTTQGTGRASQFIDLVLNIPNVAGTSINIGGDTTYHRCIERCWIKEVGLLTSMSYMFWGCYSLQSVPLFNTEKVTNMGSMFGNCYSLQSVPLFNTEKVTNMLYMFRSCYSLQSVPLFNTKKVTNMSYMFRSCYSLQSVPLFNTEIVSNMSYMFGNCESLQSVPLFNTEIVSNMSCMFEYCYSLQSVPLFNTEKVTNMTYMFYRCYTLLLVQFTTPLTSGLTDIFSNIKKLQKCVLSSCTVGFSVSGCLMSATALNEMFTALGTASGAQTITITGNYGAATCDTTIATAKGFTIVS